MIKFLKRLILGKKKKKNKEVKVYSEHQKGIVFNCINPKCDNIDMSDSIHVLSRPFGEAIWFHDSKGNICSSPSEYLKKLENTSTEDFKKEYFNYPEYTDEDRRIDDSQDKGIYSYPVGISEGLEISESWIDDSYNTPTDSTSYDSSNSYDDSSTSSGDW